MPSGANSNWMSKETVNLKKKRKRKKREKKAFFKWGLESENLTAMS